MGQLELEFEFVIERQSLGCAQFQPFVELGLDRVLAVKVRLLFEHHHDQPSEFFDVFEVMVRFVFFLIYSSPRRLRLVGPQLLVGKLMVNAALTPLRHLMSKA